jgi:excisionase family DNA binding protein
MKKYLNFNDTCDYLGVNKHTLYNWTHLNKIPHKKINRKLLFSVEELERWIEENTVPTEEDIKYKAEQMMQSRG